MRIIEAEYDQVGQPHYRTDTPSTQMQAEDLVRCEEQSPTALWHSSICSVFWSQILVARGGARKIPLS